MEGREKGKSRRRDDIYSQSLRAGNRTYFFDVKSTKSKELYLTITESKRRFNNDNGKFYYEKHKLFLYPEDFESFAEYLNATLEKIHEMSEHEIVSRDELNMNNEEYDDEQNTEEHSNDDTDQDTASFSNVSFEDLGNEEEKS
jgi:hypothetical protein